MSRVDVYSRQQAEEVLEVTPDTAVISISQPGNRMGWNGFPTERLLYLEFWDLAGPALAYPEAVLFDETMAEQLQAFVDRHRGGSFLVHCDAGISRSVAVGLWISETLDLPLHLHATHTTAAANGLVLRLLRRAQWEEQLNR